MPRPRCSAFLAASLDGFIAGPRGELEWLRAVEAPGEDYGFAAFFGSVDALLVGRATWEVAGGFDRWPYEGKRVAVMAHAPREARHGETFHRGDPAEVLALTLSVIPVVLGDGIRLFQGPLPERPLALVSARPFPSGLVQLVYRRAPRP
jgi:dihydrofolate reductase